MTAATSGDPDRLRVVGQEVRRCMGRLAGGVADYRSARAAFLSAPNELGGPPVEDHSQALEDRCEELGRLTELIDAFADALCDADTVAVERLRLVDPAEAGAFLVAVGARVGVALDRATDANDRTATAIHATRASVHTSRWVNASQRLYYLHREYYTPPRFFPDATAYNRHVAGHRAWLQPRVDALRGRATSTVSALRRSEPITRVGRWIDTAPAGAGRALRYGGRALGGLGAGLSLIEAGQRYEERDGWGVARSLATAAGGVAMLFPPTAVAGAVAVGGVLLWEEREHVAAAGRWVAGRLQSAGQATSDVLAGGSRRLVAGLFGP